MDIPDETAVYPNCVIDKLCKEAQFIRTKEDISNIVGLRLELQDTFLTVILDILSLNPISRFLMGGYYNPPHDFSTVFYSAKNYIVFCSLCLLDQ